MFPRVTSALNECLIILIVDHRQQQFPSISLCRRAGLHLAVAADAVLAVLGRLGAAAALRHFLVVSGQQSFNLGGDLPLIHGRTPLLVHLQLLPQSADGSLLTGNQFLQVLVPQLLPRSALSGALTASFQFGLQVDLCRFAATFARFLNFTSHHLVFIHCGER